jgi:ergothioneine biosynthesis protein EgtB
MALKGVADRSPQTFSAAEDVARLARHYRGVRQETEFLCEPLEPEDYVLQSMPDASPAKWHLAHTSWFFETFVLRPHLPNYRPFHPQFALLFNSYYNAIGPRWPRPHRGLLSRPPVAEVYRYRKYVDQHMAELFQPAFQDVFREIAAPIDLGLNHEQQHQELILTDLKHLLALNPLYPVYRESAAGPGDPPPFDWVPFPGGMAWVGHDGTGFAFDNEGPRHRVFVESFRLASRLAVNQEYLAFMADGGYQRPELWLSDGWNVRQTKQWAAPLYWEQDGDHWWVMTLAGRRPLNPNEPVCHLSFYEADAFARWAGARLPTEAEWEIAAGPLPLAGHFLESRHFHPAPAVAADDQGPVYQRFGDVWQWTASAYQGYPGYQPLPGALGEYNGKFMCNQLVLRGASCATPRSHARSTYRNFFPPEARWQFSGVRLAQDLT